MNGISARVCVGADCPLGSDRPREAIPISLVISAHIAIPLKEFTPNVGNENPSRLNRTLGTISFPSGSLYTFPINWYWTFSTVFCALWMWITFYNFYCRGRAIVNGRENAAIVFGRTATKYGCFRDTLRAGSEYCTPHFVPLNSLNFQTPTRRQKTRLAEVTA